MPPGRRRCWIPALANALAGFAISDDAITTTFYYSIASAWARGVGSSATPVGKMDTGVTAAATTYYYVFAITTRVPWISTSTRSRR